MAGPAKPIMKEKRGFHMGNTASNHFQTAEEKKQVPLPVARPREFGPYQRMLLVGAIFTCIAAVLIGRIMLSAGSSDGWKLPVKPVSTARHAPPIKRISSTDHLMDELKAHSLWELPDDQWIPTIIFANYPSDLNWLDVETKKRAFLHTLLPAVLLARAEIERERQALEEIIAKFGDFRRLVFSGADINWQKRLSAAEIQFIEHLSAKYRSVRASDLLARVDTLPVSLIMAQAAIESSWGTSRFSEVGNNLFGLWTWSEQGLVPAAREAGKNHKIATYDSILGSVRAYHLTINRLPAYRQLRKLRRETQNPLLLAEGLHRYSERGEAYVRELKSIIRYNQLDRYDRYNLAGDLPAGVAGAVNVSQLL
jgi:Bax protein